MEERKPGFEWGPSTRSSPCLRTASQPHQGTLLGESDRQWWATSTPHRALLQSSAGPPCQCRSLPPVPSPVPLVTHGDNQVGEKDTGGGWGEAARGAG